MGDVVHLLVPETVMLQKRLCCKNNLSPDDPTQSPLPMRHLQKFETRILLEPECLLFIFPKLSGRAEALLPPSPLRTGLTSFQVSGSSKSAVVS